MKNLKSSANKIIFATDIGNFALTWVNDEICSLSLSEEKVTHQNIPTSIQKIIKRIQSYTKGNKEEFCDIKVNLESLTPFQKNVLIQTRKIKYGEVVSYQEIANKINNPKAVRAVGGALGKNPIALIIPCHRIIGKNNSLVGFSMLGGINTKQQMINLEKDKKC